MHSLHYFLQMEEDRKEKEKLLEKISCMEMEAKQVYRPFDLSACIKDVGRLLRLNSSIQVHFRLEEFASTSNNSLVHVEAEKLQVVVL